MTNMVNHTCVMCSCTVPKTIANRSLEFSRNLRKEAYLGNLPQLVQWSVAYHWKRENRREHRVNEWQRWKEQNEEMKQTKEVSLCSHELKAESLHFQPVFPIFLRLNNDTVAFVEPKMRNGQEMSTSAEFTLSFLGKRSKKMPDPRLSFPRYC